MTYMNKRRTLSDESVSEKRLQRIQSVRSMSDEALVDFIEENRKRISGRWKVLQDAEEELIIRMKKLQLI